MSERRATNVTWHHGEVPPEARRELLGHRGACLWLTGLSGSGKSTLARRIERRLVERGVHAYVLDGDNVRHGLNADLGFGPEDRTENIRRIGEVARLFVDAGTLVLTAFISPYRADRGRVRALFEAGAFFEVHVATPLEVCEQRDPKGLYRRARAGEIAEFTGISAPYEAPEAPEIRVDTAAADLDACAAQVIDALADAGVL
ncbi:MAG TPA: adenylyl-sulfate kinase [Sandaracinaceae bacterium LLY-WYZ-13_1]|nr:adenylyl-sulfate kinase [Sandaracinaceae bacterium LLY-WYZ-13_1]